jgi:putative MATE family efflux protein
MEENQLEQKTNRITEGPIGREMIRYFLPLVAGTIFQQVYSLVDAVVVGRFVGTIGIGAIGGSASTIIYIVTMIVTSLFSGASVMLSQAYGARDEERLHRALHTLVGFALMASVVTTVLGVALSRFMMEMMNTPEELMEYSMQYMVIYFCGISAVILYNTGASILRAVGDSKRPFRYLIVCCVLNVVLDILLVVVIPMEVIGAALATVVSQGISAFLVIRALVRNREIGGIPFHLSLRLRNLRANFDGRLLRHQLELGIPGSIQAVAYGVTNIVIQSCINGFGTDVVAAWAAYFKTDVIFWATMNAFGVTVTTFCGQNFGAGKKDRVIRTTRVGFLQSAVLQGVIIALLILFARPILCLFLTDEYVIQIGVQMMYQFMPWYMIAVFLEILNGSLRGLGDVKVPTVITVGSTLGVRLPWLLILVPRYHEILTVILSYPLAWGFSLLLTIPYYLYRKKKVLR